MNESTILMQSTSTAKLAHLAITTEVGAVEVETAAPPAATPLGKTMDANIL